MGVLIVRARTGARKRTVLKFCKQECNGFWAGPLALVNGRENLATMLEPRREQLINNDYEIESQTAKESKQREEHWLPVWRWLLL